MVGVSGGLDDIGVMGLLSDAVTNTRQALEKMNDKMEKIKYMYINTYINISHIYTSMVKCTLS